MSAPMLTPGQHIVVEAQVHEYSGGSLVRVLMGDGLNSHLVTVPAAAARNLAEITPASKLREAAEALHDDCMEYSRINNLGGHNNYALRMMRAALDLPELVDASFVAKTPAPAPTLEEVAQRAAEQFESYERQHRAKGTPDADAKAEVNRLWAADLRAALAARQVKS